MGTTPVSYSLKLKATGDAQLQMWMPGKKPRPKRLQGSTFSVNTPVGKAFITVNERDHDAVLGTARRLIELGFSLAATRGTAAGLRKAGLVVRDVLKMSEGRPNCVDAIKSGEIALIINTPLGQSSRQAGRGIRVAAVQHRVPLITTLSGAAAAVEAIAAQKRAQASVLALQELHR
ncbi:MAG: hypothetical protein HYZ27_03255 [Deltaproteobacteria bacterium]|nr:hypothetical protein [Deltaproteobacteria bacterium]